MSQEEAQEPCTKRRRCVDTEKMSVDVVIPTAVVPIPVPVPALAIPAQAAPTPVYVPVPANVPTLVHEITLDTSSSTTSLPTSDQPPATAPTPGSGDPLEDTRSISLGLRCFLTSTKPFVGAIKQRYSDFLVNEIDEAGNVVRLTTLSPPMPGICFYCTTHLLSC